MTFSCSTSRRVRAWFRAASPPSSASMYLTGWQRSPPPALRRAAQACTARTPPWTDAPTMPEYVPTEPMTIVGPGPWQAAPGGEPGPPPGAAAGPVVCEGVFAAAGVAAPPPRTAGPGAVDGRAPWSAAVAGAVDGPAPGPAKVAVAGAPAPNGRPVPVL